MTEGNDGTRRQAVLLVDGSALAYRAHFAMARSGLSLADGTPIGAVFGFANDLHRLLGSIAPTHAAVVFDTKDPTFRHALYPDYKVTREKMPDELVVQLPWLDRVAEALGFAVLRQPGHEADDVIGTLAKRASAAALPTVIVTGDKDLCQLVDDHVRIWVPARDGGAPTELDAAGVVNRLGVPPHRVVDFLSLVGDASDNAPGVPGVGEKTAITLIERFGGLDDVLAHAAEVDKPKLRESLMNNREVAELTRKLVTIDTDCPLPATFESLAFAGPKMGDAAALFGKLGFRTLGKAYAEAPKPVAAVYRIIRTETELNALLAELSTADLVALDTETTSIDPLEGVLVGVSVSTKDGDAAYVPMNLDPAVVEDPPGASFRGAATLARLKPWIEDVSKRKCGQNAKYDILVFRQHGVRPAGYVTDTMLASYLLEPGSREHNLDALALRHFNYTKIATEELLGKGPNALTMDLLPVDEVGKYACEDADFTRRLAVRFLPEIDAASLRPLHDSVEMPLVGVLADMEETGVRVDRDALKKMARELEAEAERLGDAIREIAGRDFNPNSPKQLGEWLFETMKVHEAVGYKPKRTKTGWGTSAEVLEELTDVPLVRQIIEYREVSKLVSTYVLPLPDLVRRDGRIHTSFNQAVAATGRLSSSNPNLQNIPIRKESGRRIRAAFLPTDDAHVLLSADYSQIELRLLAHFAKDEALLLAFREGRDIHRETAARVFGVAPDSVDAATRARAKAVNFGVLYGMGPNRLARETGLTLDEAKAFIARYFDAFPKVRGFLDGLKDEARRTGMVTTILGRRRPIPEITSPNGMLRSQAENMAVNTPIQGSAADLIKVAMIRVAGALASGGLASKLVLQVHDELLLDVAVSELDTVKALVRDGMENAFALDVPLKVDIGTGASWLEAH